MDPELAALLASLESINVPLNSCLHVAAPTTAAADFDLESLLATVERTRESSSRMHAELSKQSELLYCMSSSIDGVLSRGERLDDVMSKASELEDDSRQFYRRSQCTQDATDGDDDFEEALSVFDKDKRGYITLRDVRHVLASLGEHIPDAEIEEMFSEVADGTGRVNIKEFAAHMASGGNQKWSDHAIRLTDLPAHFSISQLAVLPKRYRIDRCPSTGMCLGTAVVDYESHAEVEVITGIVNILLLCDTHGWGWRKHTKDAEESADMFQQELREGLRSLSTILQKDGEPDLSDPVGKWLPCLTAACGLPLGALLSLFFHRYTPSPGQSKANAVREFGSAILLILQRQPPPEVFSDLEGFILPYSNTYVKRWDVFVWEVCVPPNAIPALPFPLTTVETTDARNHYEPEGRIDNLDYVPMENVD
jgi:Ca2+-binding EF-hand superfamily protein